MSAESSWAAQLPLTDPPVLYGLGLTSNLLGRALRFDLLTQLCGVGVVLEQGERSVDEGERAWIVTGRVLLAGLVHVLGRLPSLEGSDLCGVDLFGTHLEPPFDGLRFLTQLGKRCGYERVGDLEPLKALDRRRVVALGKLASRRLYGLLRFTLERLLPSTVGDCLQGLLFEVGPLGVRGFVREHLAHGPDGGFRSPRRQRFARRMQRPIDQLRALSSSVARLDRLRDLLTELARGRRSRPKFERLVDVQECLSQRLRVEFFRRGREVCFELLELACVADLHQQTEHLCALGIEQ